MIEETANIGLVKEDKDEFYNVDTVNGNLDKIDEEFGKKVNKVEGKGLSSNDYTDEEKEKLKNIDQNANNYVHPTTAGNKHIPTGGSVGQVLKYGGSSGTASWGSDSYYGTCSTAAATAAKTVSMPGFKLVEGAHITVRFAYKNTSNSTTLNVNGTGAYQILVNGSGIGTQTQPSGIITAGGVYNLAFTGSENLGFWNICGIETVDTKDRSVSFTSADSTSPTTWTDVPVLSSESKHSTLFNRISTMFKNVRYLYKLLGKTNISAIGDGTVTGILNGLQSTSIGLESSYANVICIYNSTICTVRVRDPINSTPVNSNFIIATLPENIRPKETLYWDIYAFGGGQIRLSVSPEGSLFGYRYNSASISNTAATLTYIL